MCVFHGYLVSPTKMLPRWNSQAFYYVVVNISDELRRNVTKIYTVFLFDDLTIIY